MGTTTQGSCNISQTHAARRCNEYGRWEEPDLTYCVSEVTANLCFIREVCQETSSHTSKYSIHIGLFKFVLGYHIH